VHEIWLWVRHQLETNQFFSAAALAGSMGSILYYLRTVPQAIYWKVEGLVMYRVNINQTDPLYFDFENWFYANHSVKYRNVVATTQEYEAFGNHVDKSALPKEGDSGKEVEKARRVFYRQNQGKFVIRLNGKRVYIFKNKERLTNTNSVLSMFFNEYTIIGVRAKKEINELLETIVEATNKKQNPNSVRVYAADYGGWYYLANKIDVKPLDKVVMTDDTVTDLLADMQRFAGDRDWYERMGIPYTRGYIFDGDPGNGKTTLALALASHLNRDVYTIDFNELNGNMSLKMAVKNIGENAILLVEDIDTFFNGREIRNKKSELSFSAVLNSISGAMHKPGMIVIFTTNRKSELDPALIRAGRMDYHLTVKNPDERTIEKYFALFYGNGRNEEYLQQYFSEQAFPAGISMSDVQNICMDNRDDQTAAMDEVMTRSGIQVNPRSVEGIDVK
jgi:hypothetical protein